VLTLINRYGEVARACFTILATVYATALGAAVASRSSRRGRTVLVASNV
jgi:hypothetical protein